MRGKISESMMCPRISTTSVSTEQAYLWLRGSKCWTAPAERTKSFTYCQAGDDQCGSNAEEGVHDSPLHQVLRTERSSVVERVDHADRDENEAEERYPETCGSHHSSAGCTSSPRSIASIDSRMLSRCFGSSSSTTRLASAAFVPSTRTT